MPRKKKRRRRSNNGYPLALLGGLAGTLTTGNISHPQGTIAYLEKGEFQYAIGNVVENVTGYSMINKRFEFGALVQGLTPVVIGALVHKFVGGKPLSLNAKLAKAGVPYIRI